MNAFTIARAKALLAKLEGTLTERALAAFYIIEKDTRGGFGLEALENAQQRRDLQLAIFSLTRKPRSSLLAERRSTQILNKEAA